MLFTTLTKIVEVCKEYEKIEKREKATQNQIKADKEKYIKRIELQREIIINYMNKSFEERSKNFDGFFSGLDKAIENNNIAIVNKLCKDIMELAKENPLRLRLYSEDEMQKVLDVQMVL